ncbi:MAG: putative transrane protein, partial [Symbiobacteriaceae bacterium]|nr:putative transrane protein [Symbiobacteriaceae bacterium]
ALGGVWLLNNLNVTSLDMGDLFRLYWPVIPIYFGLTSMVEVAFRPGAGSRGFLWGSLAINLILTLVFAGVLGNINDWWYVELSLFWKALFPAVLLFVGISMLGGGIRRPGAKTYLAIMSGSKDARTTWDDLSIINIMGGSTIDLSQAGLPDKDVLIDVHAIMGGGDLRVPAGVKVVCELTALMGGAKILGKDAGGLISRTVVEAGEGPVIRVRALTIMGGFDVKVGPKGYVA